MKKMLAVLLALSLTALSVGCAPAAKTGGITEIEAVVLTRAESESLVAETEFPSAFDADVLGNNVAYTPTNGESPTPILTATSTKDDYIAATEVAASTVLPVPEEVRAMWFSFYDLSPILKGRSEAQFTKSITTAFQNCKSSGFNTMIVQVRPHGDALYPSDYFPWSRWLDANDEEGNDPGYDPFAIMVDVARGMGLRVEAWINPYRIRTDSKPISSDNQAFKWLDEGNDNVIRYKGSLYYNPARKEAQTLIINGVKEVVRNYKVDGIHFDDYFYPNPDNAFDQQAYDEYLASGGTKNRGDWRRSNVDTLVKAVYSAVKNINKDVIFGISPQGNRSNNYNQQYADVNKWMSNPGYVDYICPQIYWGFNHTSAPFRQVAREWNSLVTHPSVKLYIGLGAYKIGGGEADFQNSTNNMATQVEYSRELSTYGGFTVFRYDSLYNPASGVRSHAQQELNNLEDVLNS